MATTDEKPCEECGSLCDGSCMVAHAQRVIERARELVRTADEFLPDYPDTVSEPWQRLHEEMDSWGRQYRGDETADLRVQLREAQAERDAAIAIAGFLRDAVKSSALWAYPDGTRCWCESATNYRNGDHEPNCAAFRAALAEPAGAALEDVRREVND